MRLPVFILFIPFYCVTHYFSNPIHFPGYIPNNGNNSSKPGSYHENEDIFKTSALWKLSNPGEILDSLNHALHNPSVKKILISGPGRQNISLPGIINVPTGKILEFDGSVMLKNCRINGGIISAPLQVKIFDTTVTLINSNTTDQYFSANWFGLSHEEGAVNDKSFIKTFRSASENKIVWIPPGSYPISQTLIITKSMIGEKATEIIYEPDSISERSVMVQVDAADIRIKNLSFNGNKKALWITEILNGHKNIDIDNCSFYGAEQAADSRMYAVGIRFREGMDGLHIQNCKFSDINASVTGIARGIIGSGKISPKNVIIEGNTFNGITNTGAKNWDSDQIVIQDYNDSCGMIIRYNKHYSISKRGQKLQSGGIYSYKNEFWSELYKTTNSGSSYAAISVYGNGTTVDSNIVWEGVFQKGIEIGRNNSSNCNIIVQNNQLIFSPGNWGNNDGIRIIGKENNNIHIVGNTIQNVRIGIWVDCGSEGIVIDNNQITNSENSAITVSPTSNIWPYTWNKNISIRNNTITNVKSYFAFNFSNIDNGTIANNTAQGVQKIINDRSLDSLKGKVHIFQNRGPQSINYGPSSKRPIIKSSSFHGLEYYNTDTKETQVFDGKNWISKKSSD